MRTRCDSVGIHEHYLLDLYVSTTELVKSSARASEVYSTTDGAAADLQLILFVSGRNCVQIRCVYGLNFELVGSCGVVFSSALSAACITCQPLVLYFNHTAYSSVRKETSAARAL